MTYRQKPKRILLISDYGYPVHAGTERLVFGLADWITNHEGIQTDILTPTWNSTIKHETVNGVNIFRFDTHPIDKSRPINRIFDFIRAGRALPKYDVYHGFYTMPPLAATTLLAKVKGSKSVITFFGRDQFEKTLTNPIKRLIIINLLKQADQMTTYTWNLESYFKNKYFSGQRITTIQGWSEGQFKITNTKPAKKKTILFVGRLTEEKGVFFLMESFAKIKDSVDAELVLIGPLCKGTKVDQEIARLGLKNAVNVKGFVSDKELNEWYNRCTVMVVPALHQDAFGLSLMEAVVCGKPVICTDSIGSPDGKKSDELIVQRGDIEGLAAMLKRLLADKVYYEHALQVSKKRRGLFDKRTVMAAYQRLYQSLFNPKG